MKQRDNPADKLVILSEAKDLLLFFPALGLSVGSSDEIDRGSSKPQILRFAQDDSCLTQ